MGCGLSKAVHQEDNGESGPMSSGGGREVARESSFSRNIPHKQPVPLSAHLNRSLKLPSPWRSERVWTRKELDTNREEFFHVMSSTNDATIWQTINAACQILWYGGDDAKDADGGLATAQALLTAAEITTPNGTMAKLFDAQGRQYKIPRYIISDPINLVESPIEANAEAEPGVDGGDGAESDKEDLAEILRRREEKGKGLAADMVKVRVRRNDRAEKDEIVVEADRTEPIAMLKLRIKDKDAIETPVRLFFAGKMLTDNQTLAGIGWHEIEVVGCMVAVPPPEE